MLSLSRPLTIIDLEATATDPESARIIQVAVQRLLPDSKGKATVADSWVTVVNPDVEIDDKILDLTGLTQAEINKSFTFKGIQARLAAFIKDADLAGYNILSYDYPLLKAEYERLGKDVPGPHDRKIVDAYQLEKRLRPRTLEAVYERRTGETLDDAHDAGADVAATKSVLLSQADEVPQNGNAPPSARDLEDFAFGSYLDREQKLKETDRGVVICFGNKHKGETLKDVRDNDYGYLKWMYETIDHLQPHINDALA